MLKTQNNIFNFKEIRAEQIWKIIFKLVCAGIGISFLLYSWIYGVVNLQELYNDALIDGNTAYFYSNAYTYTQYYFSFFTIQTNIFCLLFFLIAGIWHNKEGKWKIISQDIATPIAIYITITALIFNSMLLPAMLSAGGVSALDWIITEWEHGLFPILFVLYVILWMENRESWDVKKFMKKKVYIYISYPLLWCIMAMIRGTLIGTFNEISETTSNPEYFNYFFLDVTTTTFGIPGYIWFLIAFVAVLSILLGTGALYVHLQNLSLRLIDNNKGPYPSKSKKNIKLNS
ncbi:Pr6Pr family membrane protein [Spiroplasma endosymbiont of Amphibalanus improvisus]|uniref:Pr6Pr family membrane protein n=1 Tax=Spiroplasma endosymbiont of Amphibalanus improvisus TaxID=3066327 RepID=UPI00313B73C1